MTAASLLAHFRSEAPFWKVSFYQECLCIYINKLYKLYLKCFFPIVKLINDMS